MNTTRRILLLLLAATLLISFPLALAQVLKAVPFWVRVQRAEEHENTCVLVRQDGSYHLERTREFQQVAYGGTFSPEEMQTLRDLVDNDDFRMITKHDISNNIVSSAMDGLVINVTRAHANQDLLFSDSEARRPFRKSLDPLLAWLSRLKKDKTLKPSAEPVNGCMPIATAKPIDKAAEMSQSAPVSEGRGNTSEGALKPARQPKFMFGTLMRITTEFISNGRVERTCVSVRDGGLYHMEKLSQGARDSMSAKIYEDALTADQLSEFKRLLDDPALVREEHKKDASGIPMREGEIILLSIPRDRGIQNLMFASYFGVSSQSLSASLAGFGADPEMKVIKPLREWIKKNIEKRKIQPLDGAVASQCMDVVHGPR